MFTLYEMIWKNWNFTGKKNQSLARLSCGYRGKFPAAPVESDPMLVIYNLC